MSPPSISSCRMKSSTPWIAKDGRNTGSLEVRLGSFADIGERIRDVRFTSGSGHDQRRFGCAHSIVRVDLERFVYFLRVRSVSSSPCFLTHILGDVMQSAALKDIGEN